MIRVLCNELRTRIGQTAYSVIKKAAGWLAARVGMKVVEADAVVLPKGFMMFDGELAKQVGVERAVIHQKIKGWQEYNCRKEKRSHFRQERWWTYGTPEYWLQNEFIWSSVSTIRRAFNDLEKAGLMLVDRAGGEWWLSALAGEAVNLKATASNLQMSLFEMESAASNWRSSIEKPSTLKQATGKRQSTDRARTGVRKDVVADFPKPEYREQMPEMAEARDGGQDGEDVLARLPGQLVTEWTNAKLPLEELVAQYGVERINDTWSKAAGFKSQIAGLVTLLKAAPAPYPPVPPPPPAPADDATNPDHETTDDAEATPDIDVKTWAKEQFSFIHEQAKSVFELYAETILPERSKWWETTYSQLEIQLDRASFDTFFRNNVTLTAVEGNVWRFRVGNSYSRDMLQHRLYREVRRVLSDVIGCDRDAIELRFEVAEAVNS